MLAEHGGQGLDGEMKTLTRCYFSLIQFPFSEPFPRFVSFVEVFSFDEA